ncbi:hypothetical protein AB0K80_04690 [Streptomyces sp. NPDC052682]|uniref:hypothetical protein n=1 Tax=Streptomyces sp. NPDC052682 TaxID=3154954 RepID=UPI003430BD63
MASDPVARQPDAAASTRPYAAGGRPAAARRRSPRVRVEVSVNELTGTVSWRTIRPEAPVGARGRSRSETPYAVTPSRREQAAALRSAGLDPARARARGAAPIMTHPAAVRTAASTPAEALPPEQLHRHLARVGALRSQLAGDLARGTRMPSAVAARLRSAATPGRVHALSAQHAQSVRASGRQVLPAAPGRSPRR